MPKPIRQNGKTKNSTRLLKARNLVTEAGFLLIMTGVVLFLKALLFGLMTLALPDVAFAANTPELLLAALSILAGCQLFYKTNNRILPLGHISNGMILVQTNKYHYFAYIPIESIGYAAKLEIVPGYPGKSQGSRLLILLWRILMTNFGSKKHRQEESVEFVTKKGLRYHIPLSADRHFEKEKSRLVMKQFVAQSPDAYFHISFVEYLNALSLKNIVPSDHITHTRK